MNFDKYVISQLAKNDITQKELAEKLGVDASLISYWSRNERSTSAKTIKKVICLFAKTEEEKKRDLFFIFFG